MGNKQNVPPPPSRAYSTGTPPSSLSASNQLQSNSQQHHRINRRRSDFQANSGRRSYQISGNGTNIGDNVPTVTITPNSAITIQNDGSSNDTTISERMRPNSK